MLAWPLIPVLAWQLVPMLACLLGYNSSRVLQHSDQDPCPQPRPPPLSRPGRPWINPNFGGPFEGTPEVQTAIRRPNFGGPFEGTPEVQIFFGDSYAV